MYLLPQQDAGFFVAYNLADRHDEGELQELFITKFRKRFVPVRRSAAQRSYAQTSTERFVGDYSLVTIALLSFVLFAWYWHLKPTLDR